MSMTTIGIAIIIAFFFTLWAHMGKAANVDGAIVGVVVTFMTFAATTAFAATKLSLLVSLTYSQWIILILTGAANGFAIYLFSTNAASPMIPTGLFLASVYLLQVAFAPSMDWVFNRESLSLVNIGGLILAGIAIVMLTHNPST